MYITINNHNNQSSALRVECGDATNQFRAAVFGLAFLIHNSENVTVDSGLNGDKLTILNQTFYPNAAILAGAVFAAPYAPDADVEVSTASASEIVLAYGGHNHRCVGGDVEGLLSQVLIPFSQLGDGFTVSGGVASYTLDGSAYTATVTEPGEWTQIGSEPPIEPPRLDQLIEAVNECREAITNVEGEVLSVGSDVSNIESVLESGTQTTHELLTTVKVNLAQSSTEMLAILSDVYDVVRRAQPGSDSKIMKELASIKETLKSTQSKLLLASLGNAVVSATAGGVK